MTTTFAISNQKGGVAKTTSCFTIAACLAEMGKHTLVVDLDPQAHLTIAAGYDPDQIEQSVADLLLLEKQTCDWSQFLLPTAQQNLYLLAADLRLAQVERQIGERQGYEVLLQDALEPLKNSLPLPNSRDNFLSFGFDYILFDCPPSMGTITILALTAANWALVPLQAEYFASRGLYRLLDVIEAVQEHTNPALDYAIFVTMYDGRNRISQKVFEEVHQHFEEKILTTPIRVDTRLRECSIAGEPVTLYAPHTRASQEYRILTNELIEYIQSQEQIK